MNINFPREEQKILKFWRKNRIFAKSIKQRAGARDFIFYEGPPTANAKPGIHHVLARAYKDVICRYKTMQGLRVLRSAGWDTHGLPVELEMEKKLGLKNKKDIEKYGIAKFNKKCKASVWLHKKDWEKLTERIGFWLDMENPYITYETHYIETLWWIIKRVWEKGLLYQDYKVVPHCPRCGTSLSSHEVALGYKTIKENSAYVRFRIKPSNVEWEKTAIVSWTTTPWTLPANVALAVNPDGEYICVPDPDQQGYWLVFGLENFKRLLANKIFPKEYQQRFVGTKSQWEGVDIFKGSEMIGIEYEPLFHFAEPDKPAYRVIAADFVSAKEGTGVVHIAPAFGEEDMIVGKKENLPVLMNVDEAGRFAPEAKEWAGMFVKDADRLIIADLQKRGLLFKEEFYEHEYPFCWRCSSPLLYYAKKSWFIKISSVKKDLLDAARTINWVPAHLKEGRFGEWLKEVKDWAFSRERYWGTPLPIWKCEKCGAIEVIGSLAELTSQRFSRNNYFLVRHGHSLRQLVDVAMCWPEKKKFGLTKRGRLEAQVAAIKLKTQKIDLIFSSDLLRARQTAEILSKTTGASIIFEKELREYNVGIFNGKDSSLPWLYLSKKKDPMRAKLPKGESMVDLAKRMHKFMLALETKYQGKNIAIVSHELPLTMLEWTMRGFAPSKIIALRKEGKITRIKTGEHRKLDFQNPPFNDQMTPDLHRPYVDSVKFACKQCEGVMSRIAEVADVWFDSGAMPFAQARWPFVSARAKGRSVKQFGPERFGRPELTAEGLRRGLLMGKQNQIKPPELFPADYISEAVDQTRGWFYTLLAVSTLLGFGAPYKNVISLGHVLDEKGEKMSKSKGNVVNPWQIIDRYGSDVLRWYFYTVNHPGDSKLFNERDMDLTLKKFILILWNSFVFFDTYADKIRGGIASRSRTVLDRWILSRIGTLQAQVGNRLNDYDITGAARAAESFIVEDLSQWYIRRSRKRLQNPASAQDFNTAAETLAYVLLETVKIIAPFAPFVSEAIYLRLRTKISGIKLRVSVHLENWPAPQPKYRNARLEEQMRRVRHITALALAERAKVGIKVRQPLAALRVRRKDLEVGSELLELIKDEVNVKKIVFSQKFALDVKITKELREEGQVREFIRRIQDTRRRFGFKPNQSIIIFYSAPADLADILDRHKRIILSQTRARALRQGQREATNDAKIDGLSLRFGIKKI